MLSFTKPTTTQDGEEIPAAETAPNTPGAGPTVEATSPSPLFGKPEDAPAPTPIDAAYDPAVRNQIQRVRLDLLSRETERLEQQLRQVLEQQNEDRQLREELRGQISSLNQRIESLLAGSAAKAAESGSGDDDLRSAVKPLLQAVMQMLDSAEATGSAKPVPTAGYSEAWAQIDAARGETPASATPPPTAEIPAEQTQETRPASEADTIDSAEAAGETDGLDLPEPDLPAADGTAASAADPEDDLDPDPEAELRIEIARLLRPKKPGGGYEPLASQAKPSAEPPQPEPNPAPSPHAAGHGVEPEPKPAASPHTAGQEGEPEPLLLGSDETPKVDDISPAGPRTAVAGSGEAVSSAPVPDQGGGQSGAGEGRDRAVDEPKPDPAQGDLRGGGAVSRSQRPSWAPRPNPMRASLPKCLTEPWEEPSRRSGGRWPFRRPRPAGGRDDSEQ